VVDLEKLSEAGRLRGGDPGGERRRSCNRETGLGDSSLPLGSLIGEWKRGCRHGLSWKVLLRYSCSWGGVHSPRTCKDFADVRIRKCASKVYIGSPEEGQSVKLGMGAGSERITALRRLATGGAPQYDHPDTSGQGFELERGMGERRG
jgi:hypothetical protein